jgi:hypothetical protein
MKKGPADTMVNFGLGWRAIKKGKEGPMSLRDIDDKGNTRAVTVLDHEPEFLRQWNRIPLQQQAAIEAEINRRLDELISSPSPNWGSIMNTSIEGGKANPTTGVKGDWSGTVFEPIYTTACGYSEEQAGMLFGNVFKRIIIGRREPWVGIRFDPTFPQRGITLQGKTYFRPRGS